MTVSSWTFRVTGKKKKKKWLHKDYDLQLHGSFVCVCFTVILFHRKTSCKEVEKKKKKKKKKKQGKAVHLFVGRPEKEQGLLIIYDLTWQVSFASLLFPFPVAIMKRNEPQEEKPLIIIGGLSLSS